MPAMDGKDAPVALELFEQLEQKLEQILKQYQSLQSENAALAKLLEDQEKALAEAQETVSRLQKERDAVRQRIDQLLNKLEVLGASK